MWRSCKNGRCTSPSTSGACAKRRSQEESRATGTREARPLNARPGGCVMPLVTTTCQPPAACASRTTSGGGAAALGSGTDGASVEAANYIVLAKFMDGRETGDGPSLGCYIGGESPPLVSSVGCFFSFEGRTRNAGRGRAGQRLDTVIGSCRGRRRGRGILGSRRGGHRQHRACGVCRSLSCLARAGLSREPGQRDAATSTPHTCRELA